MSDADRKRLVAILGMLGSASAGERDNAARLAEQFRRQHGLTWAQLFEPRTVYVEREVFVARPAPPPEPEPPPVWPDHPPYQPPPAVGPDWKAAGIAAALGASVIMMVVGVMVAMNLAGAPGADAQSAAGGTAVIAAHHATPPAVPACCRSPHAP